MDKKKNINENKTRWLLGAGITTALGATLCCVAPLVLFLLGINGAWIGNLTAMAPYKPYFLIAAIAFVAGGFWKVYKKPKAQDCEPGTFCAMPYSDRINKTMLWVAVSVIVLVLIYPYVAPSILERL
ncbi:mercuric transporter MerT family protein [Candidatus Pelagibacter sp.]|jgi:mercuric ion transport protein|uniref:mercuric transporter MerT family protein n=1 Tax=Candidatus Pelagibacter sp. TaxID=2024849 RepID=UPI003D0F283A